MKIAHIMANPYSGNQEAEKYAPVLKDKLLEFGVSATIAIPSSEGGMVEAVKNACSEKVDFVFVLGGDGSVTEAAQIISEIEDGPQLGIIPCGTVNNFYQSLGGPNNPQKAIDQLADLKGTKIDLAKVNDQYVLSTVSAGTVPETAWKVDSDKKENFGKFAYIMDGFKALEEEVPHTYTIKTNEETVEKTFSLFVIGIRGVIFGIPNFFSEATFNDGQLHFFGLSPSSIPQKLKVAKDVLNQTSPSQAEGDLTTEFTFKQATIASDYEGFVTVDGNKGPQFPLDIKVIPEALSVIMP